MKRYLLGISLCLLALVGGLAGFNYWVDPYGIHRPEVLDAHRLSRVDQFFHMRLSKPYQLRYWKPTTVVVGSSRSGTIDIEEFSSGDTAYNLSLPGMTAMELSAMVVDAQATRPLERLTIGLEAASLVSSAPVVRSGFYPDRLARSVDGEMLEPSPGRYALDMAETLLSTSATVRSMAAIIGNDEQRRLYYPAGHWENRSTRLVGRSGFVFNARALRDQLHADALGIEQNLMLIEELLRFCHEKQIDTRLFINPEHLFFVNLWRELGYFDQWSEFHRGLIATNESVAQELGLKPFPIWGFNLKTGLVGEPLPKPGSDSPDWFPDGIHYDARLGRLILDEVWNLTNPQPHLLHSETIGAYIYLLDKSAREHIEAQPELYAEYFSLLDID